MTDAPDGPPSQAFRKFLGTMLIAIGFLMAALCGLCTLAVSGILTTMANDPQSGIHDIGLTAYLFVFIVGGIPTAIGVALIYIGTLLFRPPRDMP
jgi:hypothetical protein